MTTTRQYCTVTQPSTDRILYCTQTYIGQLYGCIYICICLVIVTQVLCSNLLVLINRKILERIHFMLNVPDTLDSCSQLLLQLGQQREGGDIQLTNQTCIMITLISHHTESMNQQLTKKGDQQLNGKRQHPFCKQQCTKCHFSKRQPTQSQQGNKQSKEVCGEELTNILHMYGPCLVCFLKTYQQLHVLSHR